MIVMKHAIILPAVALVAVCASSSASARADIGVFVGIPGPVVEAAPTVVYDAPPPVYAPPVVYGYPYPDGDWDRRRWHHKHWKHHHDDDDDD